MKLSLVLSRVEHEKTFYNLAYGNRSSKMVATLIGSELLSNSYRHTETGPRFKVSLGRLMCEAPEKNDTSMTCKE